MELRQKVKEDNDILHRTSNGESANHRSTDSPKIESKEVTDEKMINKIHQKVKQMSLQSEQNEDLDEEYIFNQKDIDDDMFENRNSDENSVNKDLSASREESKIAKYEFKTPNSSRRLSKISKDDIGSEEKRVRAKNMILRVSSEFKNSPVSISRHKLEIDSNDE